MRWRLSSMNWRLGLLRLWVVVSVLWLATCGAWALFQWQAATSARYPVTDPNGLKFIVIAPAGTAKADILPFVRNSEVVKMWQADCSKERSISCRQEIPVQMPGEFLDVVQFLIFAMSIPLLVVIFGLIFGWVISGFQKQMIPKS
jgi:hypothetical protein